MKNRDAITLDEARELLDDRIYGLAEAMQASVKEWREKHHGAAIQSATRASIIGDLFYWNVTTLSLAGSDGMTTETVKQQRFVAFDGRVLLRCKFVKTGLELSNYQTRQARNFVTQRPITGFPEFDRLHVGYRLDLTGMALKDAFILLPVGNRTRFNEWVWQFWGESIESTSTYGLQVPLPLPQMGQRRFYYEDCSQRFA